jgi:hypothetical protein
VALAVRVRVPYWAARGITAKVNGEAQPASVKPESYWTVERTWKTGDRLEVSLPMSVHVHPMPDDRTVQAFMYGPLVLAGALGNEGLTYEMMYSDPLNPRRGEGMRGQPVPAPELIAPSADPRDWIKPVGDPTVEQRDVEVVAGSPGDWTRAAADGGLAFHVTQQSRALSLIPLSRVFGQRFAVYWRVKQA